MVEKNIPEDAAVSTEESQVKEVVHVVKEEVTPVQEEAPVSEVVDEVQDSSLQVAVEINTKAEDQPKKSYASIVSGLVASSIRFYVFAYITLADCSLEVWMHVFYLEL